MIKNIIIICRKIIIIFKFKFFERKISLEISFIIAQSKVATCRYNQELSIEKEQEYDYEQIEKDENINDEKNLIETSKSNNEYEEIIVTSSFTNLQSMENYNDETAKNLLKTSINCKLGMLLLFKLNYLNIKICLGFISKTILVNFSNISKLINFSSINKIYSL